MSSNPSQNDRAPEQLSPNKGRINTLLQPNPAHNCNYYFKCMFGGVLACGTTHAAMTPVDATKCNVQVNPAKYRGLVPGMRLIVAEEGLKAIAKGFTPTLLGYSAQGAFKYGLYEYFKDLYCGMVGPECASKYKGLIWCAGSASAELFADIALCPMEMLKVKIQTSPKGTFPVSFLPALSKMVSDPSNKFPFGSITPLWSRQIPYTVAKFFFFEKIVQLTYTHILTAPKETYSKSTQLMVTFSSGYVAGVVCAVVSHPADTLVSLLSKPENKGKTLVDVAKNFGIINTCIKGLGARIFMIGTLTGLQWWIYDSFKTAFGLGTTGGK